MSPTDLPIVSMQADLGHLPMAPWAILVWTTCLLLVYASTLCRTMGWMSSTTQKGCLYHDAGGGCYIQRRAGSQNSVPSSPESDSSSGLGNLLCFG